VNGRPRAKRGIEDNRPGGRLDRGVLPSLRQGSRQPRLSLETSPGGRRRARTPDESDWARIAALYDALAQLAPSPVVEFNRAVAVGMAFGPEAGLDIVDYSFFSIAAWHSP